MVHVALGFLVADGVQHLLHAGHPQGEHVQHLGFPPAEQGRAVRPVEHPHLGGQGADLFGGAPVEAHPFLQQALPHLGFHQRVKSPAYLIGSRPFFPSGLRGLGELLLDALFEIRLGLCALRFIGDAHQFRRAGGGGFGDPFQGFGGVIDEGGPLPDLFSDLRLQIGLDVH